MSIVPIEVSSPVAARETALALAQACRSVARRRMAVVAAMVVCGALVLSAGLAYQRQVRRAELDPCPGEWPVWGRCMRSTQLFNVERPFLQFCSKNRDLMRVCIRKRTCEEFRACALSTVERWRHRLVLASD